MEASRLLCDVTALQCNAW